MPDGIFWWALGVMPIGMLINSPWVTLQGLLLALLWFAMEANFGLYPLLFPAFIAAAIVVLCRGERSVMLFLAVILSVGVWFECSLVEYW